MNFHLGKPILVLLVLALLSGVVVAFRPEQRKADLTVWVFADSHFKSFHPLIPAFEKKHNVKVNLNLLNGRAMSVRLGQLFMADPYSDELPDLCEVEINMIGRFFRPPLGEVGFRPLDDDLARSGLRDRIVSRRFAPWSKDGVVFGVPHDIHPCTITYRDDLFREAGVDLSQARTWEQFHALCIQFTQYWRSRGQRYRHAVELSESSSDMLQVMLLQRGINPIDGRGQVQLEDPRAAQTLSRYARMVAGPGKISAQVAGGQGAFTKDLVEGNLSAFITPDWRLTYIKRYGGPGIAGKMRMMPLPVFDPADAPTATHGGTCMTMPRACRDPELAWKLMEHLYFSAEGLAARRAESEILPPIRTTWSHPHYHQPDPFLGGQKGAELFISLADSIPPKYVTPASGIATVALNQAVVNAAEYVRTQGSDGLDEYCRELLTETAHDLRSRMQQMRYEP